MKWNKCILLSLLVFCLLGCKMRISSSDGENSRIELKRYDKVESRYLNTGDFTALQDMNTGYPLETRTLIEDVLKLGRVDEPDINKRFLEFFQDSTLRVIIADVSAQYASMEDIEEDLNDSFDELREMLPELKRPEIYTQISALNQSIVVGNGSVGISLDKYLGADYPIYKRYYLASQRETMKRQFIVPDCLSFYLLSEYPMENFETVSQHTRDMHMAAVFWVVSKAMGRRIYSFSPMLKQGIQKVERYMGKHDISCDSLLRISKFD